MTTNDVHDGAILEDLLNAAEADIEQVSADGAYDQLGCYKVIEQQGARGLPHLGRTRRFSVMATAKHPHIRAIRNLRLIRKRGRKAWKKLIDYHRRSIAETTMFRHKATFGGKVRSRRFDNQAVEILLQYAALNRMIQLAKPETIWVED